MARSFATAIYSPTRTQWTDSFYYQPVDELPVLAGDTTLTETRNHHISTTGRNYLQLRTYTANNWNSLTAQIPFTYPFDLYSEYDSSYFVDTYPYPTAYTKTTWNLSAGGTLSNGTSHAWFNDLRPENAFRNNAGTFLENKASGDRHTIMWAETNNELVESTGYTTSGGPYAENVVTWDLSTTTLPGSAGPTAPGVIAARIPLAPLLFNYADLVAAGGGDLGHMVGWVAHDYQNSNVWPARWKDGAQANGLPNGSIIRLKSDFNVAALPNEPLRAFARTLKKYGAILYDRNLNNAVFGVPSDNSWPTNFGTNALTFDSFERVDMSSVAGSVNSIAVASVTPPVATKGGLDILAERITALEP